MALTDAQWERVAPLISSPGRRKNGRALRRYVRRWKLERLFAWLQNYRRLVNRWEHHAENFPGPEVGAFTQTHATRPPAPWGRVEIGDTVWMKWAAGPIVAKIFLDL